MAPSRLRTPLLLFLVLAAFAGTAVGTPPAATNFVATMSGDQETPARDTPASGVAKFRLSSDGTTMSYFLNVEDISNAVASHIHVGEVGVAGPAIVFLYGPVPAGGGPIEGRIAEGSFTANDFVGVFAGRPMEDLVALFHEGGAYVNVHTSDGVAPPNTGPGDFPGGEIRGQVRVAGPS